MGRLPVNKEADDLYVPKVQSPLHPFSLPAVFLECLNAPILLQVK